MRHHPNPNIKSHFLKTPYDNVMGATILIIEGDNMLQEHLARHFKIQNWRLYNAMAPSDIKRMLKKHPIDVVLLSLNDIKKEGLVLIKMIKKMRPPVQVITVNSPDQISLSIEGMKLGVFDDFLMPLDLDSLVLRIRDACQAKKDAEIIKPSLLRRCQNLMVAASFAEAGEAETAKEMLARESAAKESKKTSQSTKEEKGD
jgi:DNA-binding NtrC family response regulator